MTHTAYSQTRPGVNTCSPSKGGLNLRVCPRRQCFTWPSAYKGGGSVNMVESGWIQNSAGLNCLIGRRCLIHTDVSLEPHRGATVAGPATESNPVCLYKLPETQHCSASSFSALPHPCFPHLLPSTPLAVLWLLHVCPNIDDPSNSWPWFVELFCLLVPSRDFFFISLFFFLHFLNST